MTEYSGNIRKMRVAVSDDNTAEYQLPVGDNLVDVNPLVGSEVNLQFTGDINCVHCGTKTKKSFNQGYCYRCLITLAQCDSCIIKPETCHYHEGTCREPEWGEEHCMSDHFVYLANTGTVKVGITRHVTNGVSSRWIDQGATQAVPIMRVQNRRVSGLVETAFKSHVADKTNWRTMLKGEPETQDLLEYKHRLMKEVEEELSRISDEFGLQAVAESDASPLVIRYPVMQYPSKIKSINLDKELQFSGTLLGIKGQYWMLDNDRVINMRKYAGYSISLSVSER